MDGLSELLGAGIGWNRAVLKRHEHGQRLALHTIFEVRQGGVWAQVTFNLEDYVFIANEKIVIKRYVRQRW